MTLLITHLSAIALGIILGGAAATYRIGKRQAPGRVSRDDFSWPGKPLRIIEAETIDAALRGDL